MAFRVSKRAQAQAPKPKHKNNVPVTRPVKDTTKPRFTVSTSNILRRKPMKEVYGKNHSLKYSRREREHDVFVDYQDQVEVSRNELLNSTHAALKHSYAQLTDSLDKLYVRETIFQEEIEAQRKQLLAPLEEETVQTTYTHDDGKTTTETFQIGQRVEAFKDMIANKEVELKQCWLDWEQVQRKIVRLGVEVLGVEAFEDGSVDIGMERKGYKKEMELLDLEYATWLEEIEEEIKEIGQEAVDNMTAAEKDINAHQKKEQAIFFAKLFADDE